ncbi:MAG: PDZ domain-containing protein, partial [Phycisphaerae bacterium]
GALTVTPPGSKASFEILRGKVPQTVTVEVGERNSSLAASVGGVFVDRFGGIVRTVDNSVRRQLRLNRISGIIVLKAEAGGRADNAGFAEGDIIVAVDGQPVKNTEEFQRLLDAADLKEGIRLDVIRDRMRGHIELRDE